MRCRGRRKRAEKVALEEYKRREKSAEVSCSGVA